MKKFLIELYYSIVYYIPNLVAELLLGRTEKNAIVVKTFIDVRWGRWKHQNWGDDMNVYLSRLWFDKYVISRDNSILSRLLKRKSYSLIGSVLQSADSRTIVWGSGLISDDLWPKEQPLQICAVRGPLSRRVLLEHGIDCPAVFGDPALLLSKYYHPKVSKTRKIGIIPHFYDEDNEVIQNFIKANPSAVMISMKHFERWEDVIDAIASCEMIISSSLHGIIVSDAYGVPNVWVEFSEKVIGKGFKFQDHFAAVKRTVSAPLQIKEVTDFDYAIKAANDYQPIQIDLQPLMDACPFKLPF